MHTGNVNLAMQCLQDAAALAPKCALASWTACLRHCFSKRELAVVSCRLACKHALAGQTACAQQNMSYVILAVQCLQSAARLAPKCAVTS